MAMAPPSLIDYVVSRKLADGVVIAGCAERSCYNRLGAAWTEQRIAGVRDPYLRARVPRSRVKTIWASPTEQSRFAAEMAEFTAALSKLPPDETKPLPASLSAIAATSSDESRKPKSKAPNNSPMWHNLPASLTTSTLT